MSTKPQELNKVIADLRQIIVGKVAMPTDQIEQITLFLFLKQLSRKHDDLVRIGSKELIFTGAWERYHFDILMRHSGEELVKECREAVESLYKNPHIDATVRKVFERSYLKILEPKVLSSFLQYLNDKFSDGLDLGDFYESLLPILGTQNELGQFRTPRHIIDFIVRVVDPNIGEKIADPACGTAGFLVAAFNYLKGKYTDEKGRLKLNPEQTKKLYNETIFGWDMEPLMVKFSLANLYLHGLKVPNVSENDTLLNENLWQHTFDIILANPPFITPKGGAKRHSRFAITSNKTEVLFCEYMVHHLNFNGRMGVIVPEGIIFDGSKGHQAIRKLFLDNGLWCVVTLPAQVFQPYSGVKTSIVFLDKTLEPENILFYKIENHGFSLNTNPAPIEKNDLPEAVKTIKGYKESLQDNKQKVIAESNYYTVPKEKILKDPLTSFNSGIYSEKIKTNIGIVKLVELGEVSDIINGYAFKSENYVESGTRVIRITNVQKGKIVDDNPKFYSLKTTEPVEKYKLVENDLLISLTGNVGRVGILPKEFLPAALNQRVACIRARIDQLNPRYLFYILNQDNFEKECLNSSSGIAQQNMSTVWLSKYKIPLPPLEVQDQIVSGLESYQKVIDGARAVTENWIPNFEIDPKWEIVKLGDVSKMVRGPFGGSLKKEIFKPSGYLVYEQYHAINDDFSFERYFIDEKKFQEMKRFEVFAGDILVSCSGTMGKIAIVPENSKKGIINQALLKLTPNKQKILGQYLKHALESEPTQQKHFRNQSGVAIPNVASVKILSEIAIPLPPIEIQKQIIFKIEEEQKIVEANKKLIDIFQQKIEAKIKSIYG
jgi:type I restriction enzyme M protein